MMPVSDQQWQQWRVAARRQLAALPLTSPLHVDWTTRKAAGTPTDSSCHNEPDLASRVSVRSRGVRYPYRCRQMVNVGGPQTPGKGRRRSRSRRKPSLPGATFLYPTMKKCPYCAEEIQDAALVCKRCGRNLPAPPLRPANPAALPEHRLWTLTKDGARAEARTRIVPIGLGRPELIFYVSSGETGELMLLWSQVFEDGRQLGELAEAKKREFEAMGWVDVEEPT